MNYYNILKLAAWSDVDPTSQVFLKHTALSSADQAQSIANYNYNPATPYTMSSKEMNALHNGNSLQRDLERHIFGLQNPENSKFNANINPLQLSSKIESHIKNPITAIDTGFSNSSYPVSSAGWGVNIGDKATANNLLEKLKATQLGIVNSPGFENNVNKDRLMRATTWIMSEPFRESNPELHKVVNSPLVKMLDSGSSSYSSTGNMFRVSPTISIGSATHEPGHEIAMHMARNDNTVKDILYYGKGNIGKPQYMTGAMNRRAALATLRMEAEANNISWKLLKQQLKNEPQLLRQLAITRSLELPGAYSTYIGANVPSLSGLIRKLSNNSATADRLGRVATAYGFSAPMVYGGRFANSIGRNLSQSLFPNLSNDIIDYAKSIGMPDYWSSENNINQLKQSLQSKVPDIITTIPKPKIVDVTGMHISSKPKLTTIAYPTTVTMPTMPSKPTSNTMSSKQLAATGKLLRKSMLKK